MFVKKLERCPGEKINGTYVPLKFVCEQAGVTGTLLRLHNSIFLIIINYYFWQIIAFLFDENSDANSESIMLESHITELTELKEQVWWNAWLECY